MRRHALDRSTISVGLAGASVVGVAFGMARYAYGLTLPDVRDEFGISELLLGLIASGTFAGYLAGLLAAQQLAARRGPRAPTTVGGVCGIVGCATVALAPSPGILAAGAVLGGSAAGWVWAPYSDIVKETVPVGHRTPLLAVITTGTSLGLVAIAGLGLLTATTSWRLVWAGTALAAALAALVNLRAVPRLRPVDGTDLAPGSLLTRSMLPPLGYSVAYFAAITAYFTYAVDMARAGGLAAAAAPLLYALIGVGGLAGLRTGRMTRAAGPPLVAAASLVVVGGGLVLLGLGRTSLTLVLSSGFLFGVGFVVGSSILDIWTARVVQDRPGHAFTVTLVVGAVTSIVTPAVMGVLIPVVGLPAMLVIVAVVAVVGAAAVAGLPRRRPPASRSRDAS